MGADSIIERMRTTGGDGVVPPSATTAPSARYASPSRQVLTLFGDYWWHVDQPFPSAALVASLGDLGVADGAARATLSRLARAEVLVGDRAGRRTSYRLAPRGVDIVETQSAWLDRFGVVESAWDGTWGVVAFSVPEAQRSLRHQARNRLRWLGYAPLHDGLWISARNNEQTAATELAQLGAARITAFRATALDTQPGEPQDAWNLAELSGQYEAFVADLGRPLPDDPGASLADRMRCILSWQSFRVADPDLPEQLLPTDWPRRRARAGFVGRYRALAASAEARVREHVAAVDAELAAAVSHRIFAA